MRRRRRGQFWCVAAAAAALAAPAAAACSLPPLLAVTANLTACLGSTSDVIARSAGAPDCGCADGGRERCWAEAAVGLWRAAALSAVCAAPTPPPTAPPTAAQGPSRNGTASATQTATSSLTITAAAAAAAAAASATATATLTTSGTATATAPATATAAANSTPAPTAAATPLPATGAPPSVPSGGEEECVASLPAFWVCVRGRSDVVLTAVTAPTDAQVCACADAALAAAVAACPDAVSNTRTALAAADPDWLPPAAAANACRCYDELCPSLPLPPYSPTEETPVFELFVGVNTSEQANVNAVRTAAAGAARVAAWQVVFVRVAEQFGGQIDGQTGDAPAEAGRFPVWFKIVGVSTSGGAATAEALLRASLRDSSSALRGPSVLADAEVRVVQNPYDAPADAGVTRPAVDTKEEVPGYYVALMVFLGLAAFTGCLCTLANFRKPQIRAATPRAAPAAAAPADLPAPAGGGGGRDDGADGGREMTDAAEPVAARDEDAPKSLPPDEQAS
eukprot:TRINITY_DN7106_c0_g1_i1.p1 TRINITY_DN7106_c0_g1~~TRINITY_DN7106_c0_g1_i1.p1  ORF type:complete len:509 (+),score=173.90 TRINITY_DN7106_c0_g1_i1:58-1584(+)